MGDAAEQQPQYPIGMVPIAMLSQVWHRAEPILQRAVHDVSGFDMPSVLNELRAGNMQLWVVGDFTAVVVTAIHNRPLHRVLWVQFLAGDHMDAWLKYLGDVLHAAAEGLQCKAVEFCGRKGWGKINKHYPEFKPVWTIYRSEINGR